MFWQHYNVQKAITVKGVSLFRADQGTIIYRAQIPGFVGLIKVNQKMVISTFRRLIKKYGEQKQAA